MNGLKIIQDLRCMGPFEIDLVGVKVKFWDSEMWGSSELTYEQIGLWIDDLNRLRQCINQIITDPDLYGGGPEYPY